MTSTDTALRPPLSRHLVPALLAGGCLAWAFGSTLAGLAQVWKTNDQYSHGYLVPFFAAFLLWLRRDKLDTSALRSSFLVGLPLLAVGIALRLAGVYYFFMWLDPIALLPCLAGACWLLGGRAAWRWAWPSILFLGFMIPLPYRLASALSGPLQRVGTEVSTFLMQTIGLPAISEGTTIWLQDIPINIVEACSGLRMLMVFVALATAVALVARRPFLDKGLLVLSSVPIAVVSNIIRITLTGVLYQKVSSEAAHAFFHDFAGWLMMPLALVMLGIELKLLTHLLIVPPPAAPRVVRDPALRRLRGPRTTRARQPRPVTPRKPASPPAAPPAETVRPGAKQS
jgi:exosortase